MPVNKNAAFRYRIIDTCLRNSRKRYPSIEDLQQAVTEGLNLDNVISASSLNKDLKAMRDHYKAPIKFNKSEKGYYYDDDNFSINAFPLTADEIAALDLSISFLKQIKYSGYFNQFESAIEKIISGFRISRIEGYENRKFIETEEPTADTGIRWLEKIYEAILMKSCLEIVYQKFGNKEAKTHQLSPYVIREYRNRWYVTGHSDLSDKLVTLALDRILAISVSKNKFIETPDFDENSFFKHAFGVTTYTDAVPSKIELLFEESQRGYLMSKPIHSTQQIVNTDSGFIVTIECYLTPELDMFILSQGEQVKVLSPSQLLERIQKRVEAMVQVYRKA